MGFIGVMGLIGLIGFRVEGRPTPLFDVGLLYLTSSSKETKYLVLAAGGRRCPGWRHCRDLG